MAKTPLIPVRFTYLAALAVVVLMFLWYRYWPVSIIDVSGNQVAPTSPAALPEIPLPSTANSAFSVGEKLVYDVIFKGITVGHAVIEVKEGPLVNDRPTWQYHATAQSTRFFDAFYKVRDDSLATVDKASLYSVGFQQDLNEGRYRAIRRYTFDYRQCKYVAVEQEKGKSKNNQGQLKEPIHDVLSALYSVRTRTITPGQDLKVTIFRNNETKDLPVKVDGEPKLLKTALGKVECLRVEPLIHGDTLFKSKNEGLVVWMTNDNRKLPVLMEATISVGLVRVKLVSGF